MSIAGRGRRGRFSFMSTPSEIDLRIAGLLAERDEPAILDLLRRGVIEPDQVVVIAGAKARLLAIAAAENYSPLALDLVAQGADVNRKCFGRTALMDACEWRNHELIAALLAAGADTEARQKAGEGEADDTPLMMSAERCDLRAVRQLLAAGADAGAVNRCGQSAVHGVLRCYSTGPGRHPDAREIVEQLLRAGAPLVGTELHFAVYRRDVAMATLLLARGSPVNAPFPRNERDGPTKGATPLIAACRLNGVDLAGGSFGFEETDDARLELVRRLLERGADPDQPDAKGMTPLRIVVPRVVDDFQLSLAKILLSAGADPHAAPAGAKARSAAALATELGLSDFIELFGRATGPGSRDAPAG